VRRRAARVSGPVTQSIGAAVQSSGYASSRGLRRSRTFGRDCDLSPRSSQARSTAGFAPHCLIPCAENAFSVEDAPCESALTVVRKIAAARAHRHPTSPDGAAQARHRHLLSARRTSTRPRASRPPDSPVHKTRSLMSGVCFQNLPVRGPHGRSPDPADELGCGPFRLGDIGTGIYAIF